VEAAGADRGVGPYQGSPTGGASVALEDRMMIGSIVLMVLWLIILTTLL
jgi:hypothetical protein